jgi:hypothetical protein
VQAGKMGDERKFSVVDVSKWSEERHQNQGRVFALG